MNAGEHILSGENDEKAFRIAFLISGYLKDDLTEAEHTELDDWVTTSMENQRLFEELIDEKNIGKWLNWKKNLRINEALTRVRKKTNFTRSLLPYISIAAAIGILVTLVLVFENKNNRQKNELLVAKDILPGTDHATLLLADGSTVLLDSAKNGNLIRQGSSMLIKDDSRKISYQNINETSLSLTQSFNTLTTPNGGQFQVVLSDGTKVWLNAASSLRYPSFFSGDKRKVELTGEGYFEVTKDPAHPFIVTAAGTTTQVLGTHFDINAYPDEAAIKITLAEGLIKVNGSLQIIPGEQAVVSAGGALQKITVDIKTETGWKDGNFVFNKTPLKEVMLQVSRWYDATISYNDNVNEHFNTTISRDVPVSKLLHLLEATGSVHFKVDGKKINVLK
jgi:transmembrane sensor